MTDENYIKRTFDLALNGLGSVSPNPLVGCVIVHDEKIIGEGWHEQYGQAHAEVNAINNCTCPELLPESTLYVNLEPCSHIGKTPACADLLVDKEIKRVVISNMDSNPLVGGNGIARLKDNGIQVTVGVLEEEGKEVNKRFFTNVEKNRPYIILKWAETADGFVARKNYDSKWISNETSRKLVHKWRFEEDGVLVGFNTVKYDNPQLNVRYWKDNDPVRIIIDRNLTLGRHYHVFDGSIPTIVFTEKEGKSHENLKFKTLKKEGFFHEMLQSLMEEDIGSMIIEGGASTLNQVISADIWDEARVFTGQDIFTEGIKAPVLNKPIFAEDDINSDKLKIFRNNG